MLNILGSSASVKTAFTLARDVSIRHLLLELPEWSETFASLGHSGRHTLGTLTLLACSFIQSWKFLFLQLIKLIWLSQVIVLQTLYAGQSPPSWWPLDTFSSSTLGTREDCQILLIAMRKYYGVDLKLEDWVVWIMLWLSRMMRTVIQTSDETPSSVCL